MSKGERANNSEVGVQECFAALRLTSFMFRMTSLIAVAGMLAVGTCPMDAQATQGRLPETLSKLNASSARFKSAEADFKREAYTALVKATDTQDGQLYLLRGRGGVQMGAKVRGGSTVEYKGGNIRVLYKAGNCTESPAGGRAETFLTLGFGGSGDELKKAWEVKDLGQETMDGVKVEHLDLTPRDPAVKGTAERVELWINLEQGVSLKQVIYAPSNDTQTAYYTNIRLNGKVETKGFEIKGPCGR